MAQFKVLRPIEHDRTLYLPAREPSPQPALSGADGKEIPVNSSGLIELTDEQAVAFNAGQIARLEHKASAVSDRRPAETKKKS